MKNRFYFYEVAVNTKTTQRDVFTYKYQGEIPTKTLVEIDFRGRKLKGFILRKTKKPNFPLKRIKSIKKIIDYFPLLENPQIKLAKFASEEYLAPIGKTIFWGLPQIAYRLTSKEPVSLPPVKKGNNFSACFYQTDEQQREKLFSQLIQKNIKKGQILLLSPNLNHWLVKKTTKKFRKKTKILDNPTRTEEYKIWTLARKNQTGLFIGSQKAVFLPFANLRLILINDPADPSFKQKQDPRVNAVVLAKRLAKTLKAKLVLAGFLPDPKTYLEIKNKKTNFKKILNPHPVHLVGLSEESKLLSFHTEQALEKVTKKGGKAIIFHNRLGFAKLFLCQDCGFSMYATKNALPPALCPICQSTKLRMHSFGLERIRYDLKKTLPETPISILTKEKKEPEGQIVVASSAGLNIQPRFNLAVLSLLEIGLSLPDPMMAYKTFHFALSSLSKGKKRILQTFIPEHYLTTAVLHFDFEWFYQHWLKLRRKLKLFPFFKELKITVKNPEKEKKILAQLKKLPEIQTLCKLADTNSTYLLATFKNKPSSKFKKILSLKEAKIEVDPL